MSDLPTYFLTWTTYGTWLHGDARGSVDDQHNQHGTPQVASNPKKHDSNSAALKSQAVIHGIVERQVIEHAIRRVCSRRGWPILALNVRSNHVHVILNAPSHSPEQVMAQLKSWCTRDLVERGLHTKGESCWTKMGSTRWINDKASLHAAIDYVLNHQ